MSWLQRNIFSRNRSGSQASTAASEKEKDEEKHVSSGDSATEANSQAQQRRLEEGEQQLREKYLQRRHEEEVSPGVAAAAIETLPLETADDSRLVVDGDDSADKLFAKLSISEMRRYEQSLQRQIAAMRAQMRQVAGTHYPELIDAADSAVALDTASGKISMQLNKLREMLESTRQHSTKQGVGVAVKSASELDAGGGGKTQVYAIAAQVKVLVDTPEQIWKALGAQRFIQAALLYLIAGEIHGRLSSGPKRHHEEDMVDPLLAFPVIERQWEAVKPFREQIAAKARQLLSSHSEVPAELGDAGLGAIGAIALLEDIDSEMACTLFLALRADSLAPLLDRLRSGTEAIDAMLHELLARVQRILADYAAVFGVCSSGSQPAGQQHASWILTTLASICADCDLPMPPQKSARPMAVAAGLRIRGRRTSSIAGAVLTASLAATPISDSFGGGASSLSTPPTPWVGERGSNGNSSSSAFIVGKYLPREIAQFRPALVAMLEMDSDEALNEADEDEDNAGENQAGLASYLGDPAGLMHVLATRVQPRLERIARHAFGLWWADMVASLQAAARVAIGSSVLAVADATRIGAAL
ncbi:hypothetical protein GGI21_004136, partial [Coemansia aciculifera]